MSSTRNKEDSNACNHQQLTFFKDLVTEKCRKVPYGSNWGSSVPGNTFKLVYSVEECTQASSEYVKELKKCIRR